MAEGTPLLSIVVASYTMDRFPDVRELLDSIAAQSYRPVETILVVEQARDLYEALCQHISERQEANIKIYFNSGKAGLSSNRNLGVREAQGAVVAFVDDDVILPPHWAEQVMATFPDRTVIGMTGPALPLWQDESMRWLPEEFHWLVSCTSWANWRTIRPVWRRLDKESKSILDVGCGKGRPMAFLNRRHRFFAVGIDIFAAFTGPLFIPRLA